MSVLALRDDQTAWDDRQIAVLRQTGIDEDVTPAELDAFLHECQRRKLDPFTRQIYLLGRWDKRKRRKVYRSQTSIDGFRLIARRAADRSGIDYGYEGTVWFDAKGGKHEVWLAIEPPAASKVVVIRSGQRFDAVAKFTEYVQMDGDGKAMGMWRSMPAGQLAKCAEALALRKAFPEDLGGIYTEEEMGQADNPQRVAAEVIRTEPNGSTGGHAPDGEAKGNPHEDPWITHSDPDAPADPEWDAQVAKMTTFGTDDEGRELWAAIVKRWKEDKLIPEREAARLQGLIKGRWKELSDSAEPIEGTVVKPGLTGLLGDWRETIDGITTPEEGDRVVQAADKDHQDGVLDSRKHKAVLAAVAERVTDLAGRAA